MAGPLTVRDMDDIGFHRREWTLQRIGWIVLALLVTAALLGFFGTGPVSETTGESSDGSVEVEYERFIRHVGTSTMTIAVGPGQVDDGKVRLFISRDLATGWRIESLSPTPSTESSSDDWLIYEFDVLGETPPEVKVLYRGEGFGRHGGAMRVGDGDPLEVWQWIYP